MQIAGESIEYYVHGKSPKLLIHSGTHGDEFESIPLILKFIKENINRLPDFVLVPMVSPSALGLKTRKNERGIDVNRSFNDNATDSETIANMKIASLYGYETCVSFHEDPGVNYFYIYDSGIIGENALATLRKEISNMGIALLSGIDDPKDPALGFKFEKGYRRFPNKHSDINDGTFWGWAMEKGKIKNMIIPEIPGATSKSNKEKIVSLIFENILITLSLVLEGKRSRIQEPRPICKAPRVVY